MSWKATAWVKEVTAGISPAEKLLLFVLADYHHTQRKIIWPSLAVIASEALMSERNARRLLRSLEEKGFLRQVRPEQIRRGTTCIYEIPALDEGGQNVRLPKPQRRTQRRTEGGQEGGHHGYRNKEELDLEPVEPVLGDKNCNRCQGAGMRGSISTPGRLVLCECAEVHA